MYHNIEGHTEIDPERVGGDPVLHGTRLPISQLIVELMDYGILRMSDDRGWTREEQKKATSAVKLVAKNLEDPKKFLALIYENPV